MEQGPGGGRGGVMSHKERLAVTGPQDEPSKGGGRGRPNIRSTREGDRSEITVFDDADRTEQCSQEIVQYQRAEPLGPLLHR